MVYITRFCIHVSQPQNQSEIQVLNLSHQSPQISRNDELNNEVNQESFAGQDPVLKELWDNGLGNYSKVKPHEVYVV